MLRINRVIFIFYASEISEKEHLQQMYHWRSMKYSSILFTYSNVPPPLFSFNPPSQPTQPLPRLLGLYCTYHHSTQVFCCEALKCFPYSSSSICQSNHHYPATEDNQINHLIITVNLFIYTKTCHPLPLYNVTFQRTFTETWQPPLSSVTVQRTFTQSNNTT